MSLVSVWHNDGFNTVEKNTKDLARSGRSKLWDTEYICKVLEENSQNSHRLSEELAASEDTIHRQIKRLENHKEAEDLYLMN